MAAAIPFIPLITGAMSAISMFMGAGKEKGVGEANAANIQMETDEAARRLEDQQQANVSIASARAAASGLKPGIGSQNLFVATLKSEQNKELSFLKRSGASRAEIARVEADARASAGKGKAFGSLMSGFSGSAKMGAFG